MFKRSVSSWIGIFVTVLLSCEPIYAGPFGFDMGMSINESKALGLTVKSQTKRSYATVLELAGSRSEVFDKYVLFFSSKGLYKIIASRVSKTTTDGQGLIRDYFTAREGMKMVYGPYQEHKVLLDATGPKGMGFMWILKEKKIRLFSSWPKYQRTKLKDHIRSIEVELVAFSLYTGAVIVTIEFINST